MGTREVTVYTCDGCRASSTVGRDEIAPGFATVSLNGRAPVWLCGVCFAAVDWVTRFQEITAPPIVYGDGVRATLRKPVS